MELKRPGTILLHLLIMVGYSVLFFALNATLGSDVIGFQWVVLLIHIFVLLIWGAINLANKAVKPNGAELFIAALLVALIGHGLCFINGLTSFNVH